MSYIEDHTLVKGDSIVMHVKKNPLFLIPIWICGVLFCWLLFIPTIQAVKLTVDCFCTEYAVTTKKIVEKYGLFHIHVDEMPLKKVENITVNKTFFGRLFNYGCICIQGTNRNNINFTDIKDADDVKRKISELIEEGPGGLVEEIPIAEPIPGESLIKEPAAREPSTEEPTVGEPVAGEPTVGEPSTEEPIAEEPSTEEATAEKSTAEKPTAEEPSSGETPAEEPTAEEPVSGETPAEELSTEEPTAEEPAAEELSTEEPTSEESAAEEPTAGEPTEKEE